MKAVFGVFNTRVFLVLALIVMGLLFLSVISIFQPEDIGVRKTTDVEINGKIFNVEVAESAGDRARGLSGKNSIPEFGGMLFRFEREGSYSFWMKNMNFPIDIIWIRGGRVVYLVKNAEAPLQGVPDSELATFTPPYAATEVLELTAGMANRFNIKEGDAVKIIPHLF